MMRPERKKVAAAITAGCLLAAGPLLFWRTFLRQMPVTDRGEATLSERFAEYEAPEPTPTPDGQARLREILPYPVNSLSLDAATGMIHMYEEGTGRAFAVNPGTLSSSTLSDVRLNNFSRTLWSPRETQVITAFTEDGGTRFRFFDYQTSRVAELPHDVSLLAFSPDGSRIVAVRNPAGRTQLWISAPDGTDPWLLTETRMDITGVSWPSADAVIITSRRADGTQSLVEIDLSARLRTLVDKKHELRTVWMRTGERALISYEDPGDGMVLSVFDRISGRLSRLPVSTDASKCAWHRTGASFTCGVAAGTSSTSSETVMTVSLQDDSTVVRYEAPEDIWIAIREPVALARDNGLAFINAFDGKPYLLSW